MSRLIADLQRVEARNAELVEELRLMREILRRLVNEADVELGAYGPLAKPEDIGRPILFLDYSSIDLTDAEAEAVKGLVGLKAEGEREVGEGCSALGHMDGPGLSRPM